MGRRRIRPENLPTDGIGGETDWELTPTKIRRGTLRLARTLADWQDCTLADLIARLVQAEAQRAWPALQAEMQRVLAGPLGGADGPPATQPDLPPGPPPAPQAPRGRGRPARAAGRDGPGRPE